MDEHLVFEAVEAGAELPGFSEMEKVGFARGFAKKVFSAGFRSFFRFFLYTYKISVVKESLLSNFHAAT